MQKLVFPVAVLSLSVAAYIMSQIKLLLQWVCENPTMWTESVGYLVPMLLVVFTLLAPKFINRYRNL